MSGQLEDEDAPAAVEVPLDELSHETLTALIESFVMREGTDYGAAERSLAEKVADVRRQLERGEARIEFDPSTESVNVVRVTRPGRR
ncbi:MAG TPA: YheU family protein [Myxococcota bacterium]|nr:YheU family protein [Myxococcota bacterium]